jgi:uncharacterized protein with HEPN domain
MKIKDRDKQAIEHIVQYCDDISSAAKRFGNSFESFSKDPLYRHACTMCILQLGEMSNHLSDNFKKHYKEISWGSIRGMRNIAAHNYGHIDLEITWEIISYDIPNLKDFCEKVLHNQRSLEDSKPEFTL